MSDAQIKNVGKDRDGDITHVGVSGDWDITHVGVSGDWDITHVGVSGDWKWTIAEIVASLESRSNTFYVMCSQQADVIVSSTPGGRKFLKTTADTTTKSNLDNLPPF
ncbi:DUF3892 domain-containing protein [Curtobacterium poinsettiae]|uniref:DUF3892 domain-containing protein n=1 Tax=Curtobacterium poinsettiae TaxID=159612 RepID=UPI00217D6DA9|nr:DUF3892 domain-containing protein [Curtobacterium flaccumfaciens]MCS6574315.1 DUF3892 domain-containing protein [Curtobacterium flaccumfaciens pv. flaccumfaciens]MDD1386567.1 DUF3892 domain-containing protein [Curtobacterium flaccumfaciens pv. poinsettiae]